MPKYEVVLTQREVQTYTATVIVEADNEDDAGDKAIDLAEMANSFVTFEKDTDYPDWDSPEVDSVELWRK